MKRILVLLFGAAAVFGADFTNGQAARLVIGQPTFTDQNPNSSDIVLGAASGIAYAADTLFVADANRVGSTPSNHRILMFQNLSSQLPGPTDQLAPGRKCPVCLGQATLVLGQPDFTTTTLNLAATRSSLRLPTSVASDGVHLVVADTDHNRVLVWNRIPTSNNAPADVVIGQVDFASTGLPSNFVPSASSLIGPQGVWIQNGKLYIADTGANRVLIYNRIPTTNGAAADVVLGQPNFTTAVQIDINQQNTSATAANMLSPVAVTSDGQRLYVADLGFNRILIWNAIPTANGAAADVAIGQPNLTSSIANNSYSVDTAVTPLKQTPVMCTTSNGVDANGNPTYPPLCSSTLNFPRFALAAAGRLFVADGGNDRVLVFNTIPATSGASADVILGQLGGDVYQSSDAADSMRTPMSLAWDGTNLYVSDAYNRRIMVYSIGENSIPYSGIRNGASFQVFATGSIAIGGSINAGDTISIAIADNSTNLNTSSDTSCVAPFCSKYTYTVKTTDTLTTAVDAVVSLINTSNSGAGDYYVVASPNHTTSVVLLTARAEGEPGNSIAYSAETSSASVITAAAAAGSLTGGANTAQLAPGTIVTIFPASATGTVTLSGTINAGDIVTIAVAADSASPGADYPYTVQSADTLTTVLTALSNAINGANSGAGDPYVRAESRSLISAVLLTARARGTAGNSIAFSVRTSSGAHITATASSSVLRGGGSLSYDTESADLAPDALPLQLAGSQVYFNGIRAPLFYVSPTQINTQIPWEVNDTTSINAFVRTTKPDGSVVATTPVAITIVRANPGIFTYENGATPNVAVALHASSHAVVVLSVDGGITPGDNAQILINNRTYAYIVQEGDSLTSVRDALTAQINASDPLVTALNSAQYSRLILQAKVEGPAGEGIAVTTNTIPAIVAGGGALVITVLANTATCCANVEGALVTADNPAVTGEMIRIYATGLGLPAGYDPTSTDLTSAVYKTGIKFPARSPNTTPQSPVSSLAGGATANLLGATPKAGMFGVFEVLLQLFTSVSPNPVAPLNISQDTFLSNSVTVPVVNPALAAGQ